MIWFALLACICLAIGLSHLWGKQLFLPSSTAQRVRPEGLAPYQRLVGLAYLLLGVFLLLGLAEGALRCPCLAACLSAPCLLLYANKRYTGQWLA